ncbi:MAG: DUF192 domain-containing protein [Candidatus Diapherotrites archaeon]|nr:DUF192 domain-containing protein [Candidatus Diapherotrites archaeon]
MLFNATQHKIVLKRVRIAQTFWQKFKGLMGEQRERFDYALVFVLGRESRAGASIHMLFVQFPIDVAFLNAKKQVVDLVENLQPWTLNCTPKKPAAFVVELPAGTIEEKGLKKGDAVEWKRTSGTRVCKCFLFLSQV